MCRRPCNLKAGEKFKIEIDFEYQERLKRRFPDEFAESQAASEM